MKPIFLFFLFVFIELSFVSAVSFSPPNLVFNTMQGEKQCQNITFGSESGKISISDNWAENKDISWNPNLFNSSSMSHGITLSYKKEISANEREIEVCIIGKSTGEYHGILLLSEEQVGNSIVQMGIWIKLNVSDKKVSVVESTEKTREEKDSSLITGAAVGSLKNSWKIIAISIGVLFVLILIVFYTRNRKEKNPWDNFKWINM